MRRRTIAAYFAFGLLALCIALLAQLPASFVPQMLQDSMQDQAMRLDNARGSLWRGTADVSITGVELGSLRWRLSPLPLLLLSPRINWQLEGTGLSGQIERDGESIIASLAGTLDIARLAPLLSRYAIGVEGRLRFENFRLNVHPQETSLAGQIHWTGGEVDVRVGGWREARLLPAMRATATESSRMLVTLWDERAGSNLLAGEIELLGDGWVKLGATGHLTKRFNESMASATDPDAILVSVEERLL